MGNKSRNHKPNRTRGSLRRYIWLSDRFPMVEMHLTLVVSMNDDGIMIIGWPDMPEELIEIVAKGGVLRGIYRGLVFKDSPSQSHDLTIRSAISLSVPFSDLNHDEILELQFYARDSAWQLIIKTQRRMISKTSYGTISYPARS